jgi:hypothetical protein
MKRVAIGDLAEMVRKILDEAKCLTYDFCYPILEFSWADFVNDTISIVKDGRTRQYMQVSITPKY